MTDHISYSHFIYMDMLLSSSFNLCLFDISYGPPCLFILLGCIEPRRRFVASDRIISVFLEGKTETYIIIPHIMTYFLTRSLAHIYSTISIVHFHSFNGFKSSCTMAGFRALFG
jgi:hypothetical protein